ncbi:hypothetical protein ABPG72_003992 [Tetrahymena utriculariae]
MMDIQPRDAEQGVQKTSLQDIVCRQQQTNGQLANSDSKEPENKCGEKNGEGGEQIGKFNNKEEVKKNGSQTNNFSIVSLSEIQLEDRLFNITEIYNVELSPTSISIAYDAYLKRNVIIKKIFKDKLDQLQTNQAILECKQTCALDHFNIVKGYDYYEKENEFILLMELVNDADYFLEKVENCHTPIKNELKLKSYVTDILNGLIYLHDQGFIHCDLKLANIFCEKHESDDDGVQIRRVKIGDLGLIQKIDAEKKTAYLEETCGTFGFKAPEAKKGAYITQQSDMWSLGIILYFMTVAYMPHHMKGYKYGQGPIPFREFDWKKRSPELRDFVQKMLSLDPSQRPSAREALQHPFLISID